MDDQQAYDRDTLAATGWSQGSLFSGAAPIAPVAWVSHSGQGWPKAKKEAARRAREGAPSEAFLYRRPSAQGDRLALVTQTCDVLKPPAEYPYVEFALVLETANAGVIREAESFTSARYFRLDDGKSAATAQIVDFRFRACADKGFLLEHPPDNQLLDRMDDRRQAIFREWLGRRLGREAVSDEDTGRIVEPIRGAWKRLSADEPQTAAIWEAKTAELRFRHSEDDRLQLYVITHEVLDPADSDVLELTDWAVSAIDWPETRVDVTVTNEWQMSIGEHRATQEIDLAWASHEESHEAA